MRTKTPAQTYCLDSATAYLRVSAAQLRESGEPSLALAVLSIARKAEMARSEALVSPAVPHQEGRSHHGQQQA